VQTGAQRDIQSEIRVEIRIGGLAQALDRPFLDRPFLEAGPAEILSGSTCVIKVIPNWFRAGYDCEH
jgi:hypothetical protein